ncbi:preprotein translocase subunit SecE [Thiofilum flexile]|uniref:preprotein translocase subunit SecE n=1 Tax=Thiofilum flexile TaxID=125627 RepID=UPI00036E65A8|nr:preprotein translocase subunit SecE [Thiofilum flexile]
MSSTTEQQSSSLDTIKLIASLALIVAAIGVFYYFATWQGEPVSIFFRVLALLIIAGAGVALAFTTANGKRLLGFLKDSRLEVRKMVWPTRAETIQTTMMVMIIVLILSIFLWLVDMLLGWGIKSLIGN